MTGLISFCDLEHGYRFGSLAILRRLVESIGGLLSRHLCAQQVIPICASDQISVRAEKEQT